MGSADVLLESRDDGLDLRRGEMVGKLETERHHHMVRPELNDRMPLARSTPASAPASCMIERSSVPLARSPISKSLVSRAMTDPTPARRSPIAIEAKPS